MTVAGHLLQKCSKMHLICMPGKSRFMENGYRVNKGAKIRNRYNQVPHLTQDTNGKVTNSQLDTTNESQEVSPFPASDHKAHINRCAQRHSKHKTEQNKKDQVSISLSSSAIETKIRFLEG